MLSLVEAEEWNARARGDTNTQPQQETEMMEEGILVQM